MTGSNSVPYAYTALPLLDVAIVGAGLSGLSAAKDLVAAGKSVLVLEARNRVGGKVYDVDLENRPGYKVEGGAEFVCKEHTRLVMLAKELGVSTFKTYAEGDMLMVTKEGRLRYNLESSNGISPLQQEDIAKLGEIVSKINQMAAEIDVEKPWTHPKAKEWDRLTVASWLDGFAEDGSAREILELTIRACMSAEPEEISLLSNLIYTARTGSPGVPGSVDMLTNVKGGSQEERFEGGPQSIATRLAERLGKDRIRLQSPVRQINSNGNVYTVIGDSFRLQARKVVVAIAPTLAGRIIYNPPLPAVRDQMCQRVPMGSLGKVFAVYETPFWREDGLSGEVASVDGVTQSTFDSSPSDGSFGIMMGFLEANQMRTFDDSPADDIYKAVLKDFVKYFGPKAQNVQQWVLQRWDNEEYSRGGHHGLFPPNVWTQFGPAVTKPIGGIHWAGTEASPYWSGFMEGAIRAGEIAAKNILDEL
ncbi:amine oxidase [Fusarium sp. MPI-SDFR-AT-0072]|nr:amine oxidase [Fusarium sp. MPI-SDFR-AT-0072]